MFGAAWQTPSVFWFVGGTDPERYAEAKQAGRSSRDSDEPPSRICTGSASDARNRRRDHGGRVTGVARDIVSQ